MSDYLGSGWKGYSSYAEEQDDIHFANTIISSWHNCPCDSCRERQAAYDLPLAEFAPIPRPNEGTEVFEPDWYATGEPPF